MRDEILVLNSGSSSIKFALFAADPEPVRLLHGTISGIGVSPGFSAEDTDGRPLPAELPAAGATPLTHATAIARLLDWLENQGHRSSVVAAGHRGGVSYEYIAGALPGPLGKRAGGRVIVAHLGNGASLCAMRGALSVATTMGFTALAAW